MFSMRHCLFHFTQEVRNGLPGAITQLDQRKPLLYAPHVALLQRQTAWRDTEREQRNENRVLAASWENDDHLKFPFKWKPGAGWH
ncbi:hypothetical protein SRHO_G00112030 [Serrasalmus rhombeus]